MKKVTFLLVGHLWNHYQGVASVHWKTHDARHHLGFEIKERIKQLDVLLDDVYRLTDRIRPDPQRLARQFSYMAEFGPKLESREISTDDYISGMPETRDNCEPSLAAYTQIRLLTEMFYLVAWRLRQVINAKAPRDFMYLSKFNAESIRSVRNLLIEHPEHAGEEARYEQHLMITDSGPILKSAAVMFRGGKSFADASSLDKGLYVNSSVFEEELRELLVKAISKAARRPIQGHPASLHQPHGR